MSNSVSAMYRLCGETVRPFFCTRASLLRQSAAVVFRFPLCRVARIIPAVAQFKIKLIPLYIEFLKGLLLKASRRHQGVREFFISTQPPTVGVSESSEEPVQ